jgi:exopolyphosphatase/guanosine-5'-triphosphate,3'-diphosphate pyrophosphatase
VAAPVAVVDIGTNCTRLLVRDGGRDLERRSTITRLGRGVDASRELAPGPIDATLAVLGEFRSAMDAAGVGAVRAVATSAVRDASNGASFLDRAGDVLGVRPELLSGAEEGRLAFAGATLGLAEEGRAAPYLVVDIGGGSTEFVVGTDEPDGLLSLDVGAVRLTESHLHTDPPAPEELSNALAVIEAYLEDLVREVPAVLDARTVIGVAGTVTTVAAVELGLEPYDRDRVHHLWLTRDAAEDVFRTLATERLADRVHNPGLHRDRADVIVGGCCVLVAVLRRFGLDGILVSETDLLDGAAATLLP